MMRWWFAALLPVVLTGCGARYFEYHSATEIPEGPGMLTGERGAFVVYSDRDPDEQDGSAPVAPREADEQVEFDDFRAFMRWREANRDTPEYREFLEWREWKAYRAWKQQSR